MLAAARRLAGNLCGVRRVIFPAHASLARTARAWSTVRNVVDNRWFALADRCAIHTRERRHDRVEFGQITERQRRGIDHIHLDAQHFNSSALVRSPP